MELDSEIRGDPNFVDSSLDTECKDIRSYIVLEVKQTNDNSNSSTLVPDPLLFRLEPLHKMLRFIISALLIGTMSVVSGFGVVSSRAIAQHRFTVSYQVCEICIRSNITALLIWLERPAGFR